MGVGGEEAVRRHRSPVIAANDAISHDPTALLTALCTANEAMRTGPKSSAVRSWPRAPNGRNGAKNTDVIELAPAVIAKPQARRMVELIRARAQEEGAGLLRRFALMRSWYESRHMAFAEFVSPDGLHLNDWSYDCIARQLAGAIGTAAAKPATTAAIAVH